MFQNCNNATIFVFAQCLITIKFIDTSLRQWYNVTDTLFKVGLDAETQWEIGIKVGQKKIN